MTIYFLTLFPDEMSAYFQKGIVGKAINDGKLSVNFINIRDFSQGMYRQVDDYPFGGKKGMILKADVLYDAISSIPNHNRYRLIYPCPKGTVFEQSMASSYVKSDGLVFICGYYEGLDERIFDAFPIERVSVGDFILTSGEMPAMMIADATLRLVPGVLGNPLCIEDESVINGRLEHPQYTAPRELAFGGVPEVLLSGHHQKIRDWRTHESLKATLFERPSLLSRSALNDSDRDILTSLFSE